MRALVLCLALAGAASAQANLEQKYKKKIAKPFVTNAAWVLDFDAARKKAAESKKFIFAYFTRSFSP